MHSSASVTTGAARPLSALDLARRAARSTGAAPLIWYFDSPISGLEFETHTDALACGLAAMGVAPRDRVALHLQNVPQYLLALVATWKLGAAAVSANPMLRERELRRLLDDCRASVLICLDIAYEATCRAAVEGSTVKSVITTSPIDLLDQPVPSSLTNIERQRPLGTVDLMELLARHRGERPAPVVVEADDLAALIYTSGTTGPPKGAMIRHRNLVATSGGFAKLIKVDGDDSILGLAPIFHVTGLVLHVMLCFDASIPLLLAYRFNAADTLELIGRRRPTFTIAAITAYTALLESAELARSDLSSLRAVYTGGAPVSPSTVERWRRQTGQYIHNAYGLTESAAPCIAVPLGQEAPVDEATGAISIGQAIAGVSVKICDSDRAEVPAAVIGEITISGPGVVDGYWEKPEESAWAVRDGRLFTGDVGFVDDSGWVYLVDRQKDLIIASGYNVWPHEVEDVLCEHPAIREAAVVGVADAYRGETVRAFVSLKAHVVASPEELVEFARGRLAAYKRPREVVILDELPKTASGKILRRELRDYRGTTPPKPGDVR